jgi:uncharacterized phage-associated protein
MTTATDVLRYMRMNYRTLGRAQRQKILYYAQAWSLVWTGRPLFTDEVEAWPQGPVVRDAWKADQSAPSDRTVAETIPGEPLAPQDAETLDAIMAFYGRFSGTALIDMTHEEYPWRHAFHEVGGGYACNQEVSLTDMRRFYSVKAMKDEDVPVKPQYDGVCPSTEVGGFREHMQREVTRWQGVNRILADR